jgi:hypothetical protein
MEATYRLDWLHSRQRCILTLALARHSWAAQHTKQEEAAPSSIKAATFSTRT